MYVCVRQDRADVFLHFQSCLMCRKSIGLLILLLFEEDGHGVCRTLLEA